MSTLTPPEIRPSPVAAAPAQRGFPADKYILLEPVSWQFYEQTQAEFMGTRLRVNFDQGRMELMTIGNLHDRVERAIGRLLETYAVEKDIAITGNGSVTCFHPDLQQALEPDECYYVQTAPPPPESKPLNLAVSAPPDLAVEIDVTNSSIPRLPIYAAMGVREVLRFDGENLTSLHRQPSGTYQIADASLAFPEFPLDQMRRFLQVALDESQHTALKAMLEWMRAKR